MPEQRHLRDPLRVQPCHHIRHHFRIAHAFGMRRGPVIPQIWRQYVKRVREIAPRRLPVARRAEHPVQHHQRRSSHSTQISMKKLHAK